jgi:hypothetical protein
MCDTRFGFHPDSIVHGGELEGGAAAFLAVRDLVRVQGCGDMLVPVAGIFPERSWFLLHLPFLAQAGPPIGGYPRWVKTRVAAQPVLHSTRVAHDLYGNVCRRASLIGAGRRV